MVVIELGQEIMQLCGIFRLHGMSQAGLQKLGERFGFPKAVMRLTLPPSWYSFMRILQILESRERITRQEREMQVRESSSERQV